MGKRSIKAELVLASRNKATGDILYTLKLTYPRFILAEVNTHRMLSRNTASSRAIPMKKLRKMVLQDPFIPISFGANKKGMQAGAEISGLKRRVAKFVWRKARYAAILGNLAIDKLGVHKQIGNRLLEPWLWTEQLVTATDLDNLIKLRTHEAAEPHFQILANHIKAIREMVVRCYTHNFPWHDNNGQQILQNLRPDDWHLPFVTAADVRAVKDKVVSDVLGMEMVKKISTARCARVSYLLPDNGKVSDIESDLKLHDRLAASGHWSPFEHVARPLARMDDPTRASAYLGNFRAWFQYRKEFATESGR